MCKNSTRYNRTRNFGLCGDAEGKKTEKFVFRSALRANQISFSHNQDPNRTSPGRRTVPGGVPSSWRAAARAANITTLAELLHQDFQLLGCAGGALS